MSRGFGWILATMFIVATFFGSLLLSFLLASGSADPAVPDLVGLQIEDANRVVAAVGLRLSEAGNQFHDTVPKGKIASQQPAAGSAFKRGRSVRVFLSLGPPRIRVPRLEGSTLTEARQELEARELTLGRVAEIENDFFVAGRIIAQSPQPHTDAAPDTLVSVLPSAGSQPEAFVMPDFIGRQYGDIADDLSRAAVRVRDVISVEYRGVPRDVVVDQSPAAGTKVTRTDRITLTLSR